MTTETLPKPAPPETQPGKRALHMFCRACYPKLDPGALAICGHACTGPGTYAKVPPAAWPLCVVCVDLIPRGCPKCGVGR